MIKAPARLKRCGNTVRLVVKAPGVSVRRTPDTTLLAMLARGFEWFGLLKSGRAATIAEIARAEELPKAYVGRVVQLALLDPEIVQRIARNEHPPELNAERLIRMVPLPVDWAEQRAVLGFS